MKIALGADHAGFRMKGGLRDLLTQMGHMVVDMGTTGEESVDYPDFAEKVARAVSTGAAERGVLICGTGIGMSMAANRISGVRAAVVTDLFTAEMSRRHNDANVFCAGARVLSPEKMAEALKMWLATPFDGGRHQQRVDKINRLDPFE